MLRQLRNVPKAAQSAAKCCLYWFVASSSVRQVICEEEEKEEGAQWGLKKQKSDARRDLGLPAGRVTRQMLQSFFKFS